MSESATEEDPAPKRSNTTDRYDFSDLFEEMGPETELVYRTIGFVLVLLVLAIALYYPVLISR